MIRSLLLALLASMQHGPVVPVRPAVERNATVDAQPEIGAGNLAPDPEQELIDDMARFQHDPLGYVLYAFPWGEGELKGKAPRAWQVKVLTEVGERLRHGASLEQAFADVIQTAVASGHGIGKSALVSWLMLWSMSTFEDTRGIVTANTEAQLRNKTWPELGKWHRLSINAHWFKYTATALYSSDPDHEKTWRFDLMPWSEHNTEAFAGLHNQGKRLVLIFDEASAIADKVWEVAEGALTDEATEILWFAFGNPTRNTGRFRECFRQYRHRWSNHCIDSRTVEGTNKVQIAKWVEDNGVDSDFVKVRVRGIFPAQSFRQLISEADVDAAYGRHLRAPQYEWAAKIIAVEPAWTGEDELVIAMRQGLYFTILKTTPYNDNDVEVAGVVAQLQDAHEADAVFIDLGYGTGIYSAGKAMGRDNWQIVAFGGKANDPGCLNKRAEMWRDARDWLKSGGAIPEDQILRGDLLAPETVARLDGKLQLESKEDMKARGQPSPNRGDALAITFAFPVSPKSPLERARKNSRSHSKTDYDPMEYA